MKRLRLSPSSVSIMVGYLQFIFTCSNLQSLRLDGGEDDEEEEGHFEFLVPRNCSSNLQDLHLTQCSVPIVWDRAFSNWIGKKLKDLRV